MAPPEKSATLISIKSSAEMLQPRRPVFVGDAGFHLCREVFKVRGCAFRLRIAESDSD
jgi:hypothetical protein